MSSLQKFITTAYSQVGYAEKPVNQTKYGRAFGLNGAQWCGLFVMWCGKMSRVSIPWTAYTPSGVKAFKDKKAWYTKNPKPGDLAYMDIPNDNLDRVSHVGIVVADLGTHVLTIEGNTSASSGNQRNGGEVAVKQRPKTWIVGYGRPKFKDAKAPIIDEIVTKYAQAEKPKKSLFKRIKKNG